MPRNFPHWLKAYCAFTSSTEAPLDFHFWTGVSTVAAVLRRQVWRDELIYKWTPNFYVIFVGPAGVVTKSTTLNLGYRLLEKVPGIHFGPDSMTWHGLGKEFEAAVEYKSYKDAKGADQKVLMSALTCSVSELGTFLRPEDKALVSFLTDIWDGKERPFKHKTQDSAGITIERPWLNIIGATTPDWMQNNFPVSMLSEGIGSRIVFVYGEVKRDLIAYPSRVNKAVDFYETEKKLVEDLVHMSSLIGPYEMTEEAFQWGTTWYKKHNESRGLHLASGRYGGYIARKQTHMHKLAMVLAACQRDQLLITHEDLIEAEGILALAERSMIKVFESVGLVDEAKHVAELIPFVRAHKWLTYDDLYRLVYNLMSKQEYLHAMRVAIEGDLFEVTQRNSKNGVSVKAKTMH